MSEDLKVQTLRKMLAWRLGREEPTSHQIVEASAIEYALEVIEKSRTVGPEARV